MSALQADLPIFHEVLQSLVDEEPLEKTLGLIARRVSEVARFAFCGIILPEPGSGRIHLAAAHAFPPRYAARLSDMYVAPAGDDALAGSPTVIAMQEGRTEVLGDVLAHDELPWRELAREFGYRSLVSVPLIAQGRVIGVLNGYSREPREFSAAELGMVETLAGQAALAVRIATLVEAQQETITALQEANVELERHRVVLERAHDIHLRLTDAVMAGAGFDAVARTLSDLIGRPVGVAGADAELICTSVDDPTDATERFFRDALMQLRHAGSDADSGQDAAVVADIRIGTEPLGWVVVPRGDETSRELDVRAVEHAATVLALEIVQERVVRATEERLRSDFLFDLVNGRADAGGRLAERARNHGVSLGRPHRVMVVELDWSGSKDRLEPSGEAAESLRPRVFRVLDDVIADRLPASLMSHTGDVITVAAPTERLDDAAATLKRVAAEMNRRMSRLSPGLRVAAGIGNTAHEPPAFAESYQEAMQCLAVMTRLGLAGQALATDDLGVLRLLLNTKQPEQLSALAHQVLGPALERDRTTDGSLLKTLSTYLDRGCDVGATASELYVHANTVKYRLRRIEELCDLNLRHPNDLLKVTIAQLIIRLTHAEA